MSALYLLAFNPRGWPLPGIARPWRRCPTSTCPPQRYGQRSRVRELRVDRDRRPAGNRVCVVDARRSVATAAFGLAASVAGTPIQVTIPGLLIDPVLFANATFGKVFKAITINQILQLQGARRGDRLVRRYLRRRMTVTPQPRARAASAAGSPANSARNLLVGLTKASGERSRLDRHSRDRPSLMEARAGGDNHGPSRRTVRLFA